MMNVIHSKECRDLKGRKSLVQKIRKKKIKADRVRRLVQMR